MFLPYSSIMFKPLLRSTVPLIKAATRKTIRNQLKTLLVSNLHLINALHHDILSNSSWFNPSPPPLFTLVFSNCHPHCCCWYCLQCWTILMDQSVHNRCWRGTLHNEWMSHVYRCWIRNSTRLPATKLLQERKKYMNSRQKPSVFWILLLIHSIPRRKSLFGKRQADAIRHWSNNIIVNWFPTLLMRSKNFAKHKLWNLMSIAESPLKFASNWTEKRTNSSSKISVLVWLWRNWMQISVQLLALAPRSFWKRWRRMDLLAPKKTLSVSLVLVSTLP